MKPTPMERFAQLVDGAVHNGNPEVEAIKGKLRALNGFRAEYGPAAMLFDVIACEKGKLERLS